MLNIHRFVSQSLVIAVAIACGCASAIVRADDRPVATVIFAAASLTNVLQELGDEYAKSGGAKMEFSFAATSMLARQVENGARADLFFSADQEWMDYLDQRNLIQRSSRRNLLGNRLALVAPADSNVQLHIAPGFPLAAALKGGRLATGDPDSVPVGKYARAALTKLGVWDQVANQLARADNVRTALAFVAKGEAPLGIVYETDARVEKAVRVVDLFPQDSHPPIVYPVALTTSANAAAAGFLEFLRGPVAAASFRRFGFTVLAPSP
jgi:molybdate transport system substrate-binding protein